MSHRIIRAYFIPALFAFLALSGLLAAQDPSPQEILKIVEQKRWQDLPASIICPADNSEMLLVPGGEFLMGVPADSPHAGKIADSSPEHMVRLDPYYIDRHEITNEQYARYLAATGAKPSSFAGEARLNGPRQPVVGVRYSDAESYAGWAKKRLPTEAEWEMAARGTDGRLYPWGSVFDPKRCNSYSNGRLEPENVGSYPLGASPYGLMDMAGNVAEWVYDAYSKDYYKESPIVNPRGPAERGNNFIVRGGDYKGEPHEITTFVRKPMNAVSAFRSIGFRCAVSAADLGALLQPPRAPESGDPGAARVTVIKGPEKTTPTVIREKTEHSFYSPPEDSEYKPVRYFKELGFDGKSMCGVSEIRRYDAIGIYYWKIYYEPSGHITQAQLNDNNDRLQLQIEPGYDDQDREAELRVFNNKGKLVYKSKRIFEQNLPVRGMLYSVSNDYLGEEKF